MYKIMVQRATRNILAPTATQLKKWAAYALEKKIMTGELTIRITNIKEITELNTTYRHKTGPTNVLSFPFDTPKELDLEIPLLGDIVICAEIVNQEAKLQGKTPEAHWAHMVIHGTLHLLGYDHEKEMDAKVMEAQEIQILQTLGFPNPYGEK